MTIRFQSSGNVRCHSRLRLPISTTTAWGQLRDFARFSSHDVFHSRIEIAGHVPRAGAALSISHRYFFFHTRRIGRILRWREGVGYAFSDLSRKGNYCGFPHILLYRLEPISGQQCLLHIEVRGKWTAALPRWMAWIWLRWVFSHVTRTVENRLLWFAVYRKHLPVDYETSANDV